VSQGEDLAHRCVRATVAEFGRLDVGVNNAAKETAGPTLDLPSSASPNSARGEFVHSIPPRNADPSRDYRRRSIRDTRGSPARHSLSAEIVDFTGRPTLDS
jgi:NAD(P)-dependent dehydrogenase (short-subunit alcohol dehydrogenase family)